MKNEEISNIATNSTYLTSAAGFVVGLIKSIDWVMIATVIIPICVALMNWYYRHKSEKKELRNKELQEQILQEELQFQKKKHESELQLAQNTANRKVELDLQVKERENYLLQQQVEELKKRNDLLEKMYLNNQFEQAEKE